MRRKGFHNILLPIPKCLICENEAKCTASTAARFPLLLRRHLYSPYTAAVPSAIICEKSYWFVCVGEKSQSVDSLMLSKSSLQ